MNFIKLISISILVSLTGMHTVAQSVTDSLAKNLVEKHKKINLLNPSRPGYRIQIFFGNDRSKAQDIRSEFMRIYPETGAYMVYHQPYFKIRVGDFSTRLEASGFLNKLNGRYTTAFIVPDEVRLPE